MKISIRLRKVEDMGKVRAFAILTLDDEFVVHGIKVIEGVNGLFVAMPNRKDKEDNFVDVAHPITSDFKEQLNKAVLDEFNKPTEEA